MTGTPWHIERVHLAEGDTPRHCHRCVFYRAKDKYCTRTIGKCYGSAHCEYYSESLTDKQLDDERYSTPSISKFSTESMVNVNTKVEASGSISDLKDKISEINKAKGFSNFSFIEPLSQELSDLGRSAEYYLASDPNVCIYKIGVLAERLVDEIFDREKIQYLKEDRQIDSINALKAEGLIPTNVESLLTVIRLYRNKAVHDNFDSAKNARQLLKYSYSLCCWYMKVYGYHDFKPLQYIEPTYNGERASQEKEANEKKIVELVEQFKQKEMVVSRQNRSERIEASKKAAEEMAIDDVKDLLEDGIIIEIGTVPTIDSKMHGTIESLYIENNSENTLEDIELKINFQPSICMPIIKRIDILDSHKGVTLNNIDMYVNEKYMKNITYDTACYLEIKLIKKGKVICYDFEDLEINNDVLETITSSNEEKYSNLLSIRGEKDNYYLNPSLDEREDRIYIPCGIGNSDKGFFIFGIKKAKLCLHKYADIYALVYNYLTRNSRMSPDEFPQFLRMKDRTYQIDYRPIYRLAIILLQFVRHNYVNQNQLKINYAENRDDLETAYKMICNYAELFARLLKINFVPFELQFSASGIQLSLGKPLGVYAVNNAELLTNAREIWFGHQLIYNLSKDDLPDMEYLLKEVSSFDTFREGQYEALSSMLAAKKSAVTIMPTGSGKSFIYYMASLLQPLPIFVVAPTDILIEDQLRNLYKFHNIDNAAHLLITEEFNFENYEIRNSINYLTPITFTNRNLFAKSRFTINTGENLKSEKIAPGPMAYCIVLDEIHCLSNWGHDFRPEYLMLSRNIIRNLDHVNIWGFTATANYTVVEDIQRQLSIPTENFFSPVAFEKYNVSYDYRECKDEDEMLNLVSEIANSCAYRNELTLIFTKDDSVSRKVSEAVGYEADIFSSDNPQSYYYFVEGKCKVLIAAEELGVGINFPNIRNIIHFGLPLSKSEYVQEIGRAGRANERVTSYVLYLENSAKNAPGDLIKRNLEIKSLSSRIKYLDNDYSRIYRKLTNDCPTSDGLYNELIDECAEIFDDGHSIMVKNYSDRNVKKAKQNLFMLFTCGFINEWYTYRYSREEGTAIFIDFTTEIDEKTIKVRMQNKLRDYFASLGEDNRKAMVETARAKTIEEIIRVYVDWYFEKYLYHHNEEFIDLYEFITGNKTSDSEQVTDEIKDYFVLPFTTMKSEESEYNDMDVRQIAEKAVAGFSQSTLANVERINSNRYSYKFDFLIFCGRLRNNGKLEEGRLSRLMNNIPENRKSTLNGMFAKLYPVCEIGGRLEILKYLDKNGAQHNLTMKKFITDAYKGKPKDGIYYGMIARELNDIFKRRGN